MNSFSRFVFLASLLLGTSLASGDTLTLKSGDKVEGKILRESATDITIEVKVSASITDEKTISKDEVQDIERLTEDDVAFQELKNLKLDPSSSFPPTTYEQVLTRLKAFQDNFPNSAHLAEVKTTFDEFTAEKARVDAGEVKYRGQWIGKEDAAKMKSEIEGEQLFTAMKSQGARGDFSGALNTFESIEKNSKGAAIFPDAVDYARQVLTSMLAQVDRALAVRTQAEAEFKRLLELSSDQKKAELSAIAAGEQNKFEAAMAAAQKAGQKWVPLIPRSRKSLETLRQAIPTEIARLAALPVQKMRDAIAKLDQARAALDAKDLATADSLSKEAATLWVDFDAAKHFAEKVAAAKAAATPTPGPERKRAAAAEQLAAAKQAEAGESKPFFFTIPGAMTIVGVVILIAGALKLLGRGGKSSDEETK